MQSARDSRSALLTIFEASLAAVDGRAAVRRQLQRTGPSGPLRLIALGKAAQAMALGARDALGGAIQGGLVIAKPGHLEPQRLAALGLDCVVGGHPVPSSGSLEAGRRLLALLQGSPGEPLLFLLSGGASSLLEVPAAGLTLKDLERAGQWLLGSGLDIRAVNRVRKSLSLVKGGGLLRWLDDRPVRALAISDVPGDDPGVIGSGPLVAEPDLARQVSSLALPDWLAGWVEQGLAERGTSAPAGPPVEIVANLDMARRAAAEAAEGLGYAVHLHGDFIDGEAAAQGVDLARKLMGGPPGVHIWGGETTVVLPPAPGRGGRNQQLALAAAMALAGRAGVSFLSAGTDGTDGPTEDAGALVDGGTLERAALDGFEAAASLAAADAGSLLAASGDLIQTGPTGTNVMDLMIGLKGADDG